MKILSHFACFDRYLLRFACFCSCFLCSCVVCFFFLFLCCLLVVLLLILLYSSVVSSWLLLSLVLLVACRGCGVARYLSSRRLSCLLILLLYSSIVVPSSWPCWIYLYTGISSCCLSCLLSCLLVVALIVYCVISYLLLSLVVLACRCFDSFRLSLLRFVSFVLTCYVIDISGHDWPRWQPCQARQAIDLRGGRFSDRGVPTPETRPVPIFTHEVKKMRFFSAKQGKNGKNLRKRKRKRK